MSEQFTIYPNRWFAWQMIPGYFGERSVPYCSPIYVTAVRPLKSGKGELDIEFFNAFYAQGVQDFELRLKVLKRAENYLVADLIYAPGEDSGRCAVINHIEMEWLRRFCPEFWYHRPPSSCSSAAQGSVSIYLNEALLGHDTQHVNAVDAVPAPLKRGVRCIPLQRMPDMEPIADLFQRMDVWRHFPNYQLERRADVFFSLYLAEALEAKLGFAVSGELAPEFPVRIGTIYPEVPIDKSYKIDYLAVSADSTRPILVDLKTDGGSRRELQDKYLLASQSVGLGALLDGLLDIFRATKAKRKYFRLLQQLERMGLLRIPESLKDIMAAARLQGAIEASRAIEVRAASLARPEIVYIQPHDDGVDTISFDAFADVVDRHVDPVSQRFASSLREWAKVPA